MSVSGILPPVSVTSVSFLLFFFSSFKPVTKVRDTVKSAQNKHIPKNDQKSNCKNLQL